MKPVPTVADVGTSSLQGTYTLDAASDDVNEAIERAIARMNVVKRQGLINRCGAAAS